MWVELRIFTKGKRFFHVSQQLLFMTVCCLTGKQPSFTSFMHGFIQHHPIFLRLVFKKEKK